MRGVSVVIPTFGRGLRILETIERVLRCDPPPVEVIVHIDQADGVLEQTLSSQFPDVVVLSAKKRLGPGGGRHQCLLRCRTDFAASFDDDSWPVDGDYFAEAVRLFDRLDDAAIVGATIWHRNETSVSRTSAIIAKQAYIGCGCVIRLAAYRQTRGLLARPVPYGGEETDLSLQLFSKSWKIYHAGDLRVYHDTDLAHHADAAITSGTVANIGLFAFLHYPLRLAPLGILQLANVIKYSIVNKRYRGLLAGLAMLPLECFRFRKLRAPLSRRMIQAYRRQRG